MAASMLELFRTLTSFSPPRIELKDAPWEAFVPWAIGQGLASLCAYNLEYRLGSAGSPEWVRHRLLSLYQGMANDNVMKLVNLKRSIDDLEGRKIVLVGSASFAESLYPHVAFRPVIDVRLLVPAADVEPLTTWLRRSEFKAEAVEDRGGAAKVLNDTRTQIFLHGGFFEDKAQNDSLMSRTLPMKPFGPSARRLDLEDALYTATRAALGDAPLATAALTRAIVDRSERYTSDRAHLAELAGIAGRQHDPAHQARRASSCRPNSCAAPVAARFSIASSSSRRKA